MEIQKIVLIVIYITLYKTKGNVIIYDKIPEDHKQYLPTDVRAFYNKLNDQERIILYDVVSIYNGTDEDAIKLIHEKSPFLSIKTAKFFKKLNDKINMLSNETKSFLNHIKYEASLLIPNKEDSLNEEKINGFIKYFVQKYNKLSSKGKEELKKDFPALEIIAKNHSTQNVVKIFPVKVN